jgi:hypothetical protein
MKSRVWILAGAVSAAVTSAACTGLSRELASLTSPSAAASMLGTWQPSAGLAAAADSCTIQQWQITGQTNNTLTGTLTAQCSGGITATGTVTGQLNGDQVAIGIVGNATAPGITNCPFSVTGTAFMEDSDTLRLNYSGTTCEGAVQGSEALRRQIQSAPAPTPPPPPPPAPEPSPAPPAPPPTSDGSRFHVPAGPLSLDRAVAVIEATGDEFPYLTAPRGSENDSMIATDELLLRMIWHLHLAGYQAGRQMNPSGAMSRDKLTVFANGGWHAFDVFRNVGTPGASVDIISLEVFPPSYKAEGGIPD